MKCSILSRAWRENWLGRWLDGIKTFSSLWTYLDKSSPNTTLNWVQWRTCFSCLHISSILSGCCDCSESGTREWILILRRIHCVLLNTKRRFRSRCRVNTVRNLDVFWWVQKKAYWVARMFHNSGIVGIFMLITVLLNSFICHYTIYPRWNLYTRLINNANCTSCKRAVLIAENTIFILYH
jgi:hypothetical protein